jgi:translation initiation factor 2 subunit 3
MASLDSDPKEKPDGLAVQDASAINVKTLSPLTPEVISRQATINIGS